VRAGIVIIGNEILSGKYADENGTYLIGELRKLGVDLARIDVIPDDVEDIADAVPRHALHYDVVFTSGGVGPTHDDVTMAGIALGFATRVVRHPELEELLRAYYQDKITEGHLRLADVPEGSELDWSPDPAGWPPRGKWPVVHFKNLYILPGVPSLFRRKFTALRERFRQQPFYTARVYVVADEASIATTLDRVVAAHPAIAFGSYPRIEQGYRVVLTVESQDPDAARSATRDLTAALGPVVVRVEEPT